MRKMYEELKRTVSVPPIIDSWVRTFIECAEEMKEYHPEQYAELCNELYVDAYGEHFNEAMAMKAVAGMQNEDGTVGAHFTVSDSDMLAQRAGLRFGEDTFNKWDWYYTLNMVYSDYYSYVPNDVGTYVNIARAFIDDKDAPSGKAYRYYAAMHK